MGKSAAGKRKGPDKRRKIAVPGQKPAKINTKNGAKAAKKIFMNKKKKVRAHTLANNSTVLKSAASAVKGLN